MRESMSNVPAAAPPLPITLVSGSDDLLVSRAIAAVVAAARAADPMAEVNDYGPGQFAADDALTLNNPSLFGGWRVVVVRGVHDLGEEVGSALMAFVHSPAPEVALVLTTTAGRRRWSMRCASSRSTRSRPRRSRSPCKRAQFAAEEARRHGGRITDDAARMLVEAVGSDLGAIAGAVEQLMAGIGPRGLINDDVVAQLFRGRAETTGFNIADAVLDGRARPRADPAAPVARGRHPGGLHPVGAGQRTARDRQGQRGRRGSGQSRAELAKALGMPDWKLDKAQKLARSWPDAALGKAIVAVAEADEGVKGGAADAAYALERAVFTIVGAREGRR